AGVGLVLVRIGVLTIDVGPFTGGAEQDSGQGLWQWFAAVIAIGSGLAAGSGAVRAGLAVRRRPGAAAKPARGPGATQAQQQYVPQQGMPAAPTGMATPEQVPAGPAPAVPAGPPPSRSAPAAVPQDPGAPGLQQPGAPAWPDAEEWAATRKVGDLPAAA